MTQNKNDSISPITPLLSLFCLSLNNLDFITIFFQNPLHTKSTDLKLKIDSTDFAEQKDNDNNDYIAVVSDLNFVLSFGSTFMKH